LTFVVKPKFGTVTQSETWGQTWQSWLAWFA